MATVSFVNIGYNSRNARRKSDLEAIRQALELCRSYTGTYPDASGGFVQSPLICVVGRRVVALVCSVVVF